MENKTSKWFRSLKPGDTIWVTNVYSCYMDYRVTELTVSPTERKNSCNCPKCTDENCISRHFNDFGNMVAASGKNTKGYDYYHYTAVFPDEERALKLVIKKMKERLKESDRGFLNDKKYLEQAQKEEARNRIRIEKALKKKASRLLYLGKAKAKTKK